MKWAWRVGQILGIRVYIHATFVLLLAWVGVSGYLATRSLPGAAVSVLFIVALFGCVLLHEFGHALTARRFGIATRDITLYPIGGLARLERMPDDPRQELWVALAGPAVNIMIVVVGLGWLAASGGLSGFSPFNMAQGSFLNRILAVNISLVLFNLLPAFPMDGGRVVRALLAMRMEYTRATQFAATLGQAMALAFGLVGLFANPFLLFIAFFVWIGAGQEASMVQMKWALGGIPVERAMVTEFHVLPASTTLGEVVELVLHGSQQDFPVEEAGHVVGLLTRKDLFAALAQHGREAGVRGAMRRELQTVDASDMLETGLRVLQACGCHTVPVIRREALVGLLTTENVGEFLAIQAALDAARRTRAGSASPPPAIAWGARG
jgi:Zn-dependent protease/predicted transcriptional regulator